MTTTSSDVRAIDVAPTRRVPAGHPGPAERQREDPLRRSSRGRGIFDEVTILNISDWHAQLTPLAEAADNCRPRARRTRRSPIGGRGVHRSRGSTAYAAEAGRHGVLKVTGGDSFGGATPPISNFFDDRPTVEIMNMMGIDAEAVGNHQFDRGEQFLRERADPAGRLPDALGERRLPERVDAGRVVAVGRLHDPGRRSRHRRLHDRGRRPTCSSRAGSGRSRCGPVVPTVNAEIARLRRKGVRTIVALGHEGANGGHDHRTRPGR